MRTLNCVHLDSWMIFFKSRFSAWFIAFSVTLRSLNARGFSHRLRNDDSNAANFVTSSKNEGFQIAKRAQDCLDESRETCLKFIYRLNADETVFTYEEPRYTCCSSKNEILSAKRKIDRRYYLFRATETTMINLTWAWTTVYVKGCTYHDSSTASTAISSFSALPLSVFVNAKASPRNDNFLWAVLISKTSTSRVISE